MRRSVRNGLAIAGMAGGVWFLGQAVAQADEQVNNVGQDNSQSATGQDSGVTGNIGGNVNESRNSVDIDIHTDVDGGDGGTNNSNVNTGVQGAIIVVKSSDEGQQTTMESVQPGGGGNSGSGDATGVINIQTGSVSVEQNANGGNVSGSGNVSLPKLPDQTNNVWQSNNQTATSTEDSHENGRPHNSGNPGGNQPFSGMDSRGHDGLTGNIGGNINESSNRIDIDIDTDVRGGDGGENNSNVNTGLQDVVFVVKSEGNSQPPMLESFGRNAKEHEDSGDAKGVINIKTGSVSVEQNANGGSVSGSGNVGQGPGKSTPPGEQHATPEVSPAASPAASAPVSHSAAVVSSAQPSKALAFTGSDVSLPLTVGLVALGLGAGLTASGRRRETQTV